MKYHKLLIAVVATLVCWAGVRPSLAQHLEKIRLRYSGTGINNYVLEMGKRTGIFKKNGLDLEVVYVNAGSLLSQALIAGTFDLSFSQGSEAMIAKIRGADVRIAAVIANRFNHVYLCSIDNFDKTTERQEGRRQPLSFALPLPDQLGAQRRRARSGKGCHGFTNR